MHIRIHCDTLARLDGRRIAISVSFFDGLLWVFWISLSSLQKSGCKVSHLSLIQVLWLFSGAHPSLLGQESREVVPAFL
jgi:hypothetical protein